MSGHSKWSNIKNRKGAQDKKRSEAFTKMAKDILTAIRSNGGNTNPEANLSLKVAIDKAREVNMPKENIERLLSRFEERKANLVSSILEGYGPFGVPIIIDTETDNRNRILAEIKLILKNFNGSLGENGSVMFQFERVGEIELEEIDEEKQLELIDMGAIDFEENIVWVGSEKYNEFLKQVKENNNFKVIRSELIYKAITPIKLKDENELNTILDLVEELEENDDVVGVYAGFDYN
jgi:YebC/PmpR family DNA-binding regulatory protein